MPKIISKEKKSEAVCLWLANPDYSYEKIGAILGTSEGWAHNAIHENFINIIGEERANQLRMFAKLQKAYGFSAEEILDGCMTNAKEKALGLTHREQIDPYLESLARYQKNVDNPDPDKLAKATSEIMNFCEQTGDWDISTLPARASRKKEEVDSLDQRYAESLERNSLVTQSLADAEKEAGVKLSQIK